MSKVMNIRECIDGLDAIDAQNTAVARYEAEKILLDYLNPRVALAYRKVIERAAANKRAVRDANTSWTDV